MTIEKMWRHTGQNCRDPFLTWALLTGLSPGFEVSTERMPSTQSWKSTAQRSGLPKRPEKQSTYVSFTQNFRASRPICDVVSTSQLAILILSAMIAPG